MLAALRPSHFFWNRQDKSQAEAGHRQKSRPPPATTVRSKYNKRAKQGEQRRQDDGSRVWLIESSARRCHRQGHLGPNAGTGGGRPGGDEVL